MKQIFGNTQPQLVLKTSLEHQLRSLCLSGPSHLGKSSFLKEFLSDSISESDLFISNSDIESVRDSIEFCTTYPLSSHNRYVIIDDAELLSDASQDAYLKLLEDSGIHSTLIFITADDGLLQPAIRSRFRRIIQWKPLNIFEMRSVAQSFGIADDNRSILLSGGRPGIMKNIYDDEVGKNYIELYDLLIRAFDGKINLLLTAVPSIVKDAKDFSQRELIAHICREVATYMLRFKQLFTSSVVHLLRYCSILISTPSANSEIHWYRMASHINPSM